MINVSTVATSRLEFKVLYIFKVKHQRLQIWVQRIRHNSGFRLSTAV